MVEITSKDDLKAWLEGKPREVMVAIAARAALRVSPLLVRIFDSPFSRPRDAFLLPIWRVTCCSVASVVAPSQDVKHAANAAAAAANAANAAAAAAAAAAYSANAAAYSANAVWETISADCTAFDDGTSPEALMAAPLWPEDTEPAWSRDNWAKMRDELAPHEETEHWSVWLDWWEDRRDGRNLFPKMQEEIALIPSEDWEKGPAHVNAMIREIRGRYVPPDPGRVPAQKRSSIRVAPLEGCMGLLIEGIGDTPNANQMLFHDALREDCARLNALLRGRTPEETLAENHARLLGATDAMLTALGKRYDETLSTPLWLEARKLREVERIDRRKRENFVNEPRFSEDIGEVLATTVRTFSSFCLVVPDLAQFEASNPEAMEASRVSAEDLAPILALLEDHQDKFHEELRAAFSMLMADARSEFEKIADRGERMTVEGVENLVKALIIEAIKEWRASEPHPVADSFLKQTGTRAADAVFGTLEFSAKAFVTLYLADYAGLIQQLPDGVPARELLERIIASKP